MTRPGQMSICRTPGTTSTVRTELKHYYRGVGWYRRHFTLDKSFAGRHFFLTFDGAFLVTDVYVNGSYLGEHQGGFAAFTFDATPYLKPGADNVIAVKVDNAINPNIPPLSGELHLFRPDYIATCICW